MKQKIQFSIITLLFGFLLSPLTVGRTNKQNDHLEKIREYRSSNNMTGHHKYGLVQNETMNTYKFITSDQNPLLKVNSNFVLSVEIRELTPPWGSPPKEKNEFSYDAKGNNIEILRSVRENSKWVLQGKGILTYDEFNREIELINQGLQNPNSNIWENWFKRTTSYNSNGQVLEVVGYFYDSGSWNPSWRNTNTYDENNKLIQKLFEWSDGTNWFSSDITEYSYDENGLLVEEMIKYYDNGSWINANKWIYTYDNLENIIELLEKMWNGESWDDYYKQIHSYNENNQLSGTLGYLLEENNWRNQTRWTNTFDENNNNIESLFEQNWDGSGWQEFERTTREFTELVTDVEEDFLSLPTEFSIEQNYPNPFNPSTKIKYSLPQNNSRESQNVSLMIYNALGEIVTTLVNENQGPGNYEILWKASNQPSGVYFYKIIAGDFVQTKKMLLIK